jgi:hypothetical protein
MRKLMLTVLSFCFLFGMVTKAEVEGVKEEAEREATFIGSKTTPMMEKYESLIKPEEEPALYKTELNPVTPETGITTGHIIAYGHYIKPPYKVEVREDTFLFLNGIRIYPSLPSKIGLEEERRMFEKYKEADKIAEPYRENFRVSFDNAQELYKVFSPQKGKEIAVDSICKLLKKDSLIVDIKAVPQGKEDILLEIKHYLPGYNMPPEPPAIELVELRMHPPELPQPLSKKEKFERKKYVVAMQKESTEKDLVKGRVLVISSSSWVVCFEMDLKKVVKVLRSDLSFEEKYEKLYHNVGGDIKEILYNFNPDEWPE